MIEEATMAKADDYKGAPRWVKILAIIAVAVLLPIVLHFLFGGGMAGIHGWAVGG